MIAAALCISAGARILVTLPVHGFTLQWQHSVEKVLWEEDYFVAGDWLLLTRARVRGSGAGMEPAPDAVRIGDAWSYRPADRWRRSVELARSEHGEDYQLCIDGKCRSLGAMVPAGAPTTLRACHAG
jgi:hypothetical protein